MRFDLSPASCRADGALIVDTDHPPLDYPAGRDLATDRQLRISAHAVYGYLATRCGFTRYVTIKAIGIQRRLNMDAVTVRLALRSLIKSGYIETAPSGESRAKSFRLVWSRGSESSSEVA